MATKVMDMGTGESFTKFLNLQKEPIGLGSGRMGFLREKVVFV